MAKHNIFDVRQINNARVIVLAGIIIVPLLMLYNYYYIWIMINKLNMNDFGKLYYSTIAFFDGQDMYASSQFTLVKISDSVSKHFLNMNPPHFHLLVIPFTLISPHLSVVLWFILSLLSLIYSLRLIISELGMDLTPLLLTLILSILLLFCGTSAFLVTGQVSLLLLLPMTYAWISARNNHWRTSGFLLGALISVKPFLIMFIPYLLIKRKFEAATVAFLAASFAVLSGMLVFGVSPYQSWLRALSLVDWSWACMNASVHGLLTRIFSPTPYYSPLSISPHLIHSLWVSIGGLLATLACLTIWHDGRDGEVDRSFALILSGSLLISPLGWIYYLWLPMGPLIALSLSWRRGWSSTCSNYLRLRNLFLMSSLPVFFVPYFVLAFFQPNSLVTLSLGSLYFWGVLFLFIGIIFDTLSTNAGTCIHNNRLYGYAQTETTPRRSTTCRFNLK